MKPSNFTTCPKCKANNFSWNGKTCEDKIDYTNITKKDKCVSSGGAWSPAWCVWTANNIPEKTDDFDTNRAGIIGMWKAENLWTVENTNSNSIKVKSSAFVNLDACKASIISTRQVNGNNFNYGESNIDNPDWIAASCTEKACE